MPLQTQIKYTKKKTKNKKLPQVIVHSSRDDSGEKSNYSVEAKWKYTAAKAVRASSSSQNSEAL